MTPLGNERMSTLAEVLLASENRASVIADCCAVIDQEVSDKKSFSRAWQWIDKLIIRQHYLPE